MLFFGYWGFGFESLQGRGGSWMKEWHIWDRDSVCDKFQSRFKMSKTVPLQFKYFRARLQLIAEFPPVNPGWFKLMYLMRKWRFVVWWLFLVWAWKSCSVEKVWHWKQPKPTCHWNIKPKHSEIILISTLWTISEKSLAGKDTNSSAADANKLVRKEKLDKVDVQSVQGLSVQIYKMV